MAGMRNWLKEGEDGVENSGAGEGEVVKGKGDGKKKNKRVVVVHCKAGKGRSGTMACSYLISECGWKASEALARFTERRMRPGFGQGVSIPSQLRWVGYVDRWTKGGKAYVDRQVEVLEVHVWGLREGVKVQVEGFVDEGKTIKLFHVFTKKERFIVDGAGSTSSVDKLSNRASTLADRTVQSNSADQLSSPISPKIIQPKTEGATPSTNAETTQSSSNLQEAEDEEQASTEPESGGTAVVFRPSKRIILPTSDINIDFERRNKASLGWTMVTAVAHVWFNTFFEGLGPESNGVPNDNGVFEIEWDKMDGIKGSSRKGTRAFEKLAVVWRAYEEEKTEQVVREPGVDSPVAQMQPADWKGGNEPLPEGGKGKGLGLRVEGRHSQDASKASSFNEAAATDSDSERGVRLSGPEGEEDLGVDVDGLPDSAARKNEPVAAQSSGGGVADTASNTTGQREGFE